MASDVMHAYLVVIDRGGIIGAYLDKAIATERARQVDGVVVEVPIVVDYRPWEARLEDERS